ncbi:hypothetical protein ACFL3F_05275 [Planctomycetota bacterium]
MFCAQSASHRAESPDVFGKRPPWKRTDFEKWATVASEAGQTIARGLIRPNAKGQTPQYQLPQ